MPTSWLIGSAAGCTIVVEHATVSGRHCRLTLDGEGYLLDDLGSTNGTFVNGRRLAGPERVNRGDTITLGQTVLLPWPAEPGRPGTERMALRIGREPDNDIVVNLPIVSGHHARVVWEGKPGELIIEDLGSANGTAVGAPDRKVHRAAVSTADTVYLGTHAIPVVQLLARFTSAHVRKLVLPGAQLVIGRNADCDQVVDDDSVSGRHARLYRAGERVLVEDLGSTNGTFVNGERVERPQPVGPGDVIVLGSHALTFEGASRSAPSPTSIEPQPGPVPQTLRTSADAMASPAGPAIGGGRDERPRRLPNPWWLLAVLIVQAPLIGLGIVLAMRTAGSPGPGGVLFGLGLAALWFGLSDAGLLGTLPKSDPDAAAGPGAGRLAVRIAALSALAVFQCVVAAVTVASGAGLKGSGPAMLALLIAAALIGLALGLTIVLLAPRPALAWGLLALAILPLWLFGGQSWPLPRMAGWARVLAGAAPSRWVFEGLLLLEADRRPVAAAPPGAAEGPPSRSSVLDEYFPAETDRMGLRADSIALGGTLVGLLATVGFIASAPKRQA